MNLQTSQWKQFRIGEISEIQYGSSLKFTEGTSGYKTFRMNEILNGIAFDNGEMKKTVITPSEFTKYRLNYGDILFNRTNSFEHVGRTGIFLMEADEYMFASYLLRLSVDRTKVSPFYLNVLMNSNWFQTSIKRLATKAVNQANINAKSLASFQIPLPSLEEQQKIAELFQSTDTSIKQVEEQEKYLLKLKNQLLRELFGDKRQFGNYLKENDFETIKFEQIAFNISERVEPQKTEYTIYVGLEHIDPDNLKIERKGKPEDVIGVKLKIYKGDIIFGKRRAYQRKVAVSDFEGICSAHSMVLRANEKAIEKDLLPFFMQSDVFMNRAVQISEGSLSPTIKWKVLANQEFVIPKREKQKQIAETFIHFDKVIEEIRQQKQTLKNLKFKLLNEILG